MHTILSRLLARFLVQLPRQTCLAQLRNSGLQLRMKPWQYDLQFTTYHVLMFLRLAVATKAILSDTIPEVKARRLRLVFGWVTTKEDRVHYCVDADVKLINPNQSWTNCLTRRAMLVVYFTSLQIILQQSMYAYI